MAKLNASLGTGVNRRLAKCALSSNSMTRRRELRGAENYVATPPPRARCLMHAPRFCGYCWIRIDRWSMIKEDGYNIKRCAPQNRLIYKVSAFTKIKGEHTSFYFTIRSGSAMAVYYFAKYALLPYRLYFLHFSTVIHPHRLRDVYWRSRDLLCSYHTILHVPAYIILPSAVGTVIYSPIRSDGEISWICDMHIDLRARIIVGVIYFTSFAITHFTVPSVLDFARRRLHLIKTHSSGACFRSRIGINKSHTVIRVQRRPPFYTVPLDCKS